MRRREKIHTRVRRAAVTRAGHHVHDIHVAVLHTQHMAPLYQRGSVVHIIIHIAQQRVLKAHPACMMPQMRRPLVIHVRATSSCGASGPRQQQCRACSVRSQRCAQARSRSRTQILSHSSLQLRQRPPAVDVHDFAARGINRRVQRHCQVYASICKLGDLGCYA